MVHRGRLLEEDNDAAPRDVAARSTCFGAPSSSSTGSGAGCHSSVALPGSILYLSGAMRRGLLSRTVKSATSAALSICEVQRGAPKQLRLRLDSQLLNTDKFSSTTFLAPG